MKKILITVATLALMGATAQSCSKKQDDKKEGKRPNQTEMFKKMDADNDGFISESEAKGPMVEHFAEIDADADGVISAEEFEAFKPQRPEGARPKGNRPEGKGEMQGKRPNMEEMFSKSDADGDGYLSESEVKGPMKEHFAEIDADNDGKLSKEELKTSFENRKGQRPPRGEKPAE